MGRITICHFDAGKVQDVGDVEEKIKCKGVCTISHTHSNQNRVLATIFDELFSDFKAN